MHFKDLSINAKLRLLALAASGVSLLLSTCAFVLNDVNLLLESKKRQLSVVAKVLGANCTAAITFDDPSTASELLGSLNLQPSVHYACVYDAKGKIFAKYRSEKAGDFVPPSLKPSADDSETTAGAYVNVTHPIIRDGERIGAVFLHASTDDLREQVVRYVWIAASVAGVSLGAGLAFSAWLRRIVSKPILRLAEAAQRISAERDYAVRVKTDTQDELGSLCREFNSMLDQIQHGERELQEAHDQLEMRVEDRTRQLSKANHELNREVNERKRTERELQDVHLQLVETARSAGMAEIATGVLHNVGNVLNSINVSATLIADRLRNSKISEMLRAAELMKKHADSLADYLTKDEKGKLLPGFIELVASHLEKERTVLLDELHSLTKNVDHVKAIVAMQQSYARVTGMTETLNLADLMEDALKLNAPSFKKFDINVIREYEELPPVQTDKQKLLQILANLVTNAKDALSETPRTDRTLVTRIRTGGHEDDRRLIIDVEDNGVGIAEENLTKIFSHGFTTKRHGHGFGLHSSAIAAKELGGALVVRSAGPGKGATFAVEIPLVFARAQT